LLKATRPPTKMWSRSGLPAALPRSPCHTQRWTRIARQKERPV